MTEPFQLVDGKQVPVYPARFPLWKSDFKIHTFQEEIEMIQGLNKSTGKNIGPARTSVSTQRSRRPGCSVTKARISPRRC